MTSAWGTGALCNRPQAFLPTELERENARLRKAVSELTLDEMILNETLSGNILSPERRQACVVHVQSALRVSKRRACRVIAQHRSTQRYQKRGRDDEADLTEAIVELARMYDRYGYRRIWGLLCLQGWQVSFGRVERIWRREGLKVPSRQPKRARFWLNDGSCIRLRPSWKNHVWSYDFVQDRTDDGKPFRMLVVLDEYSRECLAIVAARRLRSNDVMTCLPDLFIQHGVPGHIRSPSHRLLCNRLPGKGTTVPSLLRRPCVVGLTG